MTVPGARARAVGGSTSNHPPLFVRRRAARLRSFHRTSNTSTSALGQPATCARKIRHRPRRTAIRKQPWRGGVKPARCPAVALSPSPPATETSAFSPPPHEPTILETRPPMPLLLDEVKSTSALVKSSIPMRSPFRRTHRMAASLASAASSAPENPEAAAATRPSCTSGSRWSLRVCTRRMAARPSSSGSSMRTSRSKRPGLVRAGSRIS
mmetsp:Transcript_42957/g.91691  ORF Transcript_42957/g.91691 Transcript_42957/m.91691 type:complete len:210 (-) Transcript_42957:827-1456(-)